jgi:hypothetical protein
LRLRGCIFRIATMMRASVLAALFVVLPAEVGADWTVTDADPVATARVEVAQLTGKDQPDFLEIACLRGTREGAYTLRAGLRAARAASGLPLETSRRELRLGRACPGPIEQPVAASTPVPIVLRLSGETVETRATLTPVFLLAGAPVATRLEGTCEIATYAVAPEEARLELEGRGETRTGYLAELLMAEHQGEVTLEVPAYGARQAFPIAGAASALVRMRDICGW